MNKVQAEIAIEPLGTISTSISDYIAVSDEMLKNYPGIRCQVNAMSTVVEGELQQVLQVLEQMHEAPFRHGIQRVVTTLRIDDRRDKETSMEQMAQEVQDKVHL